MDHSKNHFRFAFLFLVLFSLWTSLIFGTPWIVIADQWIFKTALSSPLVLVPAWFYINEAVSFLGRAGFFYAVFLVSAVVFLAQKSGRIFVWYATATTFALFSNWGLKLFFLRIRPEGLSNPTSYAYPSGHTVGAIVFYGLLMAILKGKGKIPLTILIAAIALSRVFLSAHWGSDVVGGALWGLFWVHLFLGIAARRHYFEKI